MTKWPIPTGSLDQARIRVPGSTRRRGRSDAAGRVGNRPQVNFERYGGFNKGRGIEPVPLLAGTPSVFDPLYPLPNFGAGGNMAFRTERRRAIGGFDNRLGAGTLTHCGEETRVFRFCSRTAR